MQPGRPIAKDAQIVIIGAGCFGASTAYHLLLQGYTNITILDRALSLPAPDASSNDINRSKLSRLTSCTISQGSICISLWFFGTLLLIKLAERSDQLLEAHMRISSTLGSFLKLFLRGKTKKNGEILIMSECQCA